MSSSKNNTIKNGKVIWFTGLSGSGKSTLAESLKLKLENKGFQTKLLDGDDLRKHLSSDLNYTENDRVENIRRAAEVAKLFLDINVITLCSFITPTENLRKLAKDIIGADDFIEIFVNCSIEQCEKRDVKGLYKKARLGNVSNFTGITSLFETPVLPDLIIDTEYQTIEACTEQILQGIESKIS